MKKFRVLCAVLCLICTICSSSMVYATQAGESSQATVQQETQGSFVETTDDISITNGSHSFEGKVPVFGSSKYLQTASAAFLYEVNSNTVLYAWNPDTPMYPASLVKIMTALIALEECDPEQTITVSASAMSAAEADQIMPKLQVGQPITLKQLILCLLVGSENDAAVVIADYIAGSQQGFVSMMNRRALELGCTGTKFVNPHGLHHEEQVSTARDMARILAEASKNEVFMECFGTRDYTLPATDVSEKRYMESTNYMLNISKPQYYNKYVTGGRTGVTNNRERCLAVTAEKDNMSLVSIVLGAKPTFEEDGITPITFGSYEETKELLDLGLNGNRVMQLLGEGQILTQYSVNNGSNAVTVGCTRTVSTVLPVGTVYSNLSIRFQNNILSLEAPVRKGDLITSVQIWYGNVCVASADVIAMNSAEVVSIESGSSDSGNNGTLISTALQFVLIVVALIIGFAGVMHIVQSLRDGSMQAQYRRRRRGRRRIK